MLLPGYNLLQLVSLCFIVYFCHLSLPQPPYNFPLPECAACWELWFCRQCAVLVWLQNLPRDCPLLVWPGNRSQRLDWGVDQRGLCNLFGGHYLGQGTKGAVELLPHDYKYITAIHYSNLWNLFSLVGEVNKQLYMKDWVCGCVGLANFLNWICSAFLNRKALQTFSNLKLKSFNKNHSLESVNHDLQVEWIYFLFLYSVNECFYEFPRPVCPEFPLAVGLHVK